MSRVILFVLVTPILLVILAALLIPLILDEETLLDIATETLKEETGAVLVVDGGARFSLFPHIALELGQAEISMPEEQEMGVKLRSLSIGLELLPLFTGNVEIGDIAIDGLQMSLQSAPEQPALDTSTLSNEQLDAFYAKRREALESAGQSASQESIAALPLALNVQRLTVTDSTLEIVAAETGKVTRVKIVLLEAIGMNLDDRLMPVTLQVQLEGEEGAPPIDITLNGGVKVNMDSQILTLDSVAVKLLGVLIEPVTVQASGSIELLTQVADIQIELALGELLGKGELHYGSFETPQIDATLHFNKFDSALLALAGPDAAAAAADDSDAGDPADDPALPLDAIRAIDTKAVLLIDEANFAGHVVTDLKFKLRAVDGIVNINALTGTVHDGAMSMRATFNAQHNIAKLNTRGGLVKMDIAQAIAATGSEPVASGKADFEWRLSSSGSTSNQLIEAMKGPIDLRTREVELQNLGVDKMLCEAVALVNGESLTAVLPDNTQFENLSVSLKMNQGKLNIQPLRAELSHAKLKGEGALNLLRENFRVTFTARLSPSLAELDPACRVNDRLTAIGWPVNCKGSLSGDPAEWCRVDSKKIIEELAGKEVQSRIEKEGSKLLDKLFKR